MDGSDAPMRVAFAGTPAFAAHALRALFDAGHEIPLVLTQPDRPAGRGMQLQPSAVKQCAQDLGLAVSQPRGLRLDGRHAHDASLARQQLEDARVDVLVVVAYGLILPRWVLDLPRHGCLNIHASLLPRWRGAAPIQRAIEAGDDLTGVCVMRMDEGLDTGEIVRASAEPIAAHDTAGTMHDRLAILGARDIVEALADLRAEGKLSSQPQPSEGITYAHKIDKAEAAIDWREPADCIERRIRAFDPFPGCAFVCGGQSVKLWRARAHASVQPRGHRPRHRCGAPGRGLRGRCDRMPRGAASGRTPPGDGAVAACLAWTPAGRGRADRRIGRLAGRGVQVPPRSRRYGSGVKR